MFLLLSFFCSPAFSANNTVHAADNGTTSPAPASICSVKNALNGAKITCTPAGGKAIEFSKTLTGTRNDSVSVLNSIEIWTANGGSQNYGFPLLLVVARPNGSSANDMTNLKALAIAKQLDQKTFYKAGDAGMVLKTSAGSLNYYYMMLSGVSFADFYGGPIPSGKTANVNNLKALGDTIVSNNGIAVQFSGSGAPSAGTQGKCDTSALKLLLNASDSERTALLDKLADAFSKNLDAFAKEDPSAISNVENVKKQITDLFTEQKTKKSIVTDVDDKEIYRTFYRTNLDGKTYPDVTVNQETLRQFSNEISDLSGDDASAQLPVKGIFGLRNKFLEMARTGDIRNALRTEIKIAYMYYYLEKNLKYRECAYNNGDKDYAQYDPQLMTQLTNLYNGTTESLQITDAKNDCDKITGNWIAALVKKGFCGMLVMMKDFADWMYANAVNWLKISLGVAENKDLTNPEEAAYRDSTGGTVTSGGGDSGGGSTPSGGCGSAFNTSKKSLYETASTYPDLSSYPGDTAARKQIGWVVSSAGKNYAITSLGITTGMMTKYSTADTENMIRAEVVNQFNALSDKKGSSVAEAQRAVLAYAKHEHSSLSLFDSSGKPQYVHDSSGDCTALFSLTNDKFGNNAKNKRVAASYDVHYTIYLGVKEIMDTFSSSQVSGTGLTRWRNTIGRVFWPSNPSRYWATSSAESTWNSYSGETAYNCGS